MLRQALQPLRYTVHFARHIMPRVAVEIDYWTEQAARIPTPALQRQALASLHYKRFHAEGGSVFAAFEPAHADRLVPIIVALQTISDYLDNLGDRTDSLDEGDFYSLHQALIDAVNPAPVVHDYYVLHPHQDDGGYLQSLVAVCQQHTRRLPHYAAVKGEVRRQMERYRQMQVYKHLHVRERYGRLQAWHRDHPDMTEDLSWWEFAAAAGSTLGVFALFLEAAQGTTIERIRRLSRVYFPWINGVHILLDYFIDQEEDLEAGDLNFVAQYGSGPEALARMQHMVRRAQRELASLPDAARHQAVLEGLLGMYLSDPKIRKQRLQREAKQLLHTGHPRARLVYRYCRHWRKRNMKKERGA